MDNNAVTYKHHKRLYFNDGNVALIASSPEKHKDSSETLVVFRLHQLILAMNSPVFKDMFSFPVTPDVELYEDVPLVRMTDNATDLEALLRVIYREPVLSITPLSPDTPLKVKPILVLADKYGVQWVRKLIICQLQRDWPQNLFDWDCLEAETESRRKVLYQYLMPCEMDDDYPEPGSAIELARQCDIPSILPAAFYHLSRIPISYDYDHIQTCWTDAPEDYYAIGRSARWNRLSKEDLLGLLHGRAKLEDCLEVLCAASYPENHPQDPTCIPEMWYAFWNHVKRECQQERDILAVLLPFTSASDFDGRWEKLCYSCRFTIATKASKCRKDIWDQIPDIFQLRKT
ncbi:hypothetical protein DENSPDRAFT_840698 [Dentipellis sp. KUC8613]|nr:hypothetical protein DENSPDRAFT_840698 [Dentipellis sp. KUC8613]